MKCATVITSFNRRDCIEYAIDSALRELPGQKIVVVDDASTDGTPQFLRERYSAEVECGAISIHSLKKNIGVSGAKNFGYEKSNTDWVIFLDSDDYYHVGSGNLLLNETDKSAKFPIIFFRCRTHTGEFVGLHQGKSMQIDLKTYLHHTSFGEALTAVNKALTGPRPPYVQELRGYEGLGCARLIKKFGPANLSSVIARIYVTDGDDRLSVSKGLLLRLPLLAKGHLLMIREFGCSMKLKRIAALYIKSVIYLALGGTFRLLSRK